MLHLDELELDKVYGFSGIYGAREFVKFDGETVYTGSVAGNSLNVSYLDKVIKLKQVKSLVKRAKELGYKVVEG